MWHESICETAGCNCTVIQVQQGSHACVTTAPAQSACSYWTGFWAHLTEFSTRVTTCCTKDPSGKEGSWSERVPWEQCMSDWLLLFQKGYICQTAQGTGTDMTDKTWVRQGLSQPLRGPEMWMIIIIISTSKKDRMLCAAQGWSVCEEGRLEVEREKAVRAP